MTADQMRALKIEFGVSYVQISEKTGVPLSTVCKVLTGETKAPRRNTVRRLTEYFQKLRKENTMEDVGHENADKENAMEKSIGENNRKESIWPDTAHLTMDDLLMPVFPGRRESAGTSIVRAGNLEYGDRKHGIITFLEREELPEGRNTELIDGVLYDMASPTVLHQELCFLVAENLRECIRKNKGNCRVLLAPSDVVIREEDPATVLQPDVFVICNRENVRGKGGRLGQGSKYYGGPELVIEVLSRSTRKKDAVLKMEKYLDAGVREFWLVDPDSQKIIVNDLNAYRDPEHHAQLVYLYGFDQKVPVQISEGACEIDFAAITKDIKSFYG